MTTDASGGIVGSVVICKRPMCGNTFARKDGLHVYCSKLCRDVDRKDQQNARRRERHAGDQSLQVPA